MKALYSGTCEQSKLPKLLQKAKRIGLTVTSLGVGPNNDVTVDGIKHISPRCLRNLRAHYTKTEQMEYLTYCTRRGDWSIVVHVSYYDDPYTEGWNKVPMKEFIYLKEANK